MNVNELSFNLEARENIINYIKKNKRCKLPWTLNEVKEAINRFQNLLKSSRLTRELRANLSKSNSSFV